MSELRFRHEIRRKGTEVGKKRKALKRCGEQLTVPI